MGSHGCETCRNDESYASQVPVLDYVRGVGATLLGETFRRRAHNLGMSDANRY